MPNECLLRHPNATTQIWLGVDCYHYSSFHFHCRYLGRQKLISSVNCPRPHHRHRHRHRLLFINNIDVEHSGIHRHVTNPRMHHH
jgi:hypothetical protein